MNKKTCGVVVWLAMSLLARSENIYVATNGVDTRTGAGDWTNAVLTISNAVRLASAADVVLVSNGTYLLTAQITVSKAITVRGFNGYSNTFVDGNYPAYSNRCFNLSGGVVLDGLTISNGCETNNEGGGGVLMYSGSLTNCLFTGNRTTASAGYPHGGGVYANGANCLIYNCRFIGNFMETQNSLRGGGGIALANGARVFNCEAISNRSESQGGGIFGGVGAVISNCVVMFNLATNAGYAGGGIYMLNGGQVVDCTMAMNIAGNSGGGIGFAGSSTMLNCNVYGNTGGYGAGIVAYDSTYTLIDRCFISNNVAVSASGYGGGIYLYNNGLVRDCLIVSNKLTGRDGGGIYADRIGNRGGAIQSCTIFGNSARYGGGIMLANTNNFVVNTIIWSNTGSLGSPNVYNTTAEQSNSYAYSCTTVAFTNTANRNITNHPQFVDAAGFNYRLQANSPSINTGSNQNWMAEGVDLDRRNRLDRFSRVADMGCYEYLPRGVMITGR